MDSLNNKLFGPLDKKYCNYFYYLTVFIFILFILSILTFLYSAIVNKFSIAQLALFLYMSLVYGAMYLQNRLLYSMCINSL